MMGLLSVLHLLDGADCVVLGGSARQSKRVHEVEIGAWNYPVEIQGRRLDGPFKSILAEEPTSYVTRAKAGNYLVAIAASSKSARGPHPQKLLIDEVDELDQAIFDTAMGQPMEGRGFPPTVTISSTHQYPDGTMTYVLGEAKKKGWPVFEWCYKESANIAAGGWLSEKQIGITKSIVSQRMWEVEYELQEPSIEGRLLSSQNIQTIFSIPQDIEDKLGRYYEFERYSRDGKYSTGCDWGKDRDFTVIVTIRYDTVPWRLVAYERVNREDWPIMVGRFEARRRKFGGIAVHDAWGPGAVVKNYFTIPGAEDFVAMGHDRTELYSSYIMELQRGMLRMPSIKVLKDEHKYVTYEDLYAGGHPPDSVSAGALAVTGILGFSNAQKKKQPAKVGKVRSFRYGARSRRW